SILPEELSSMQLRGSQHLPRSSFLGRDVFRTVGHTAFLSLLLAQAFCGSGGMDSMRAASFALMQSQRWRFSTPTWPPLLQQLHGCSWLGSVRRDQSLSVCLPDPSQDWPQLLRPPDMFPQQRLQ